MAALRRSERIGAARGPNVHYQLDTGAPIHETHHLGGAGPRSLANLACAATICPRAICQRVSRGRRNRLGPGFIGSRSAAISPRRESPRTWKRFSGWASAACCTWRWTKARPAGPANFAGPLWRELFQHACKEANRLGLQINMNNDAGWCGSGGPWITPELSMQKVTWSETRVKGGRRFEGLLPEPPTVKVHNTLNPITFQPEAVAASGAVKGYYADIAVLAVPEPMDEQKGVPAPAPAPKVKSGKRRAAAAMAPPKGYRIEAIQGKASFVPQHFPPQPATFATLPAARSFPATASST